MNSEIQEFGWWIKILANKPMYIYYFGPFNSYYEAQWHQNSYIQDLNEEGSQIIDIQINPYQPKQLTISIEAISA